MSGHLACLLILILSLKAEVEAKAQHDPQYIGMCWLRW